MTQVSIPISLLLRSNKWNPIWTSLVYWWYIYISICWSKKCILTLQKCQKLALPNPWLTMYCKSHGFMHNKILWIPVVMALSPASSLGTSPQLRCKGFKQYACFGHESNKGSMKAAWNFLLYSGYPMERVPWEEYPKKKNGLTSYHCSLPDCLDDHKQWMLWQHIKQNTLNRPHSPQPNPHTLALEAPSVPQNCNSWIHWSLFSVLWPIFRLHCSTFKACWFDFQVAYVLAVTSNWYVNQVHSCIGSFLCPLSMQEFRRNLVKNDKIVDKTELIF